MREPFIQVEVRCHGCADIIEVRDTVVYFSERIRVDASRYCERCCTAQHKPWHWTVQFRALPLGVDARGDIEWKCQCEATGVSAFEEAARRDFKAHRESEACPITSMREGIQR